MLSKVVGGGVRSAVVFQPQSCPFSLPEAGTGQFYLSWPQVHFSLKHSRPAAAGNDEQRLIFHLRRIFLHSTVCFYMGGTREMIYGEGRFLASNPAPCSYMVIRVWNLKKKFFIWLPTFQVLNSQYSGYIEQHRYRTQYQHIVPLLARAWLISPGP